MITILSYLVYSVISISITVWVATTLFKSGRPFLVEAFEGNEELADSVNHLLVVGFYLLNLGYVSFVLKMDRPPITGVQAIELLSQKLGVVLIVLGGMHFFNIYLFSRFRSGTLLKHKKPPVTPARSIG